MDSTLEFLSDYAARLSYQDLPSSTIHAVKRRLIDSLGCALAAVSAEPCQIAERLCYSTDSSLTSRVIGSLKRTSTEMAAFANATMVRYQDLSDAYRFRDGGHPSDAISAVLSAAEAVHADGESLITAIALAYEVEVRLIEEASFESRGWDQQSYVALGAALGAGKVLGLTREQLGNAAALALIANVAMYQNRIGEISMWKAAAAGNACRQGVFAALLAREGMTGPEEAVEGRYGLKNQLTGAFSLQPLGGGGIQFAVERPTFKTYPVRDSCQLAIAAALELREQLSGEKIKSLQVKSYASAVETGAKSRQLWEPKNRETADHSVPFSIAAALIDGDVTPETFARERFLAQDVLDLMGRMQIEEEPRFTAEFPNVRTFRITARTRSGKTREVHRAATLEELRKWMTDERIEMKFLKLAGYAISSSQARAVLDLLWHLEEVKDSGRILDYLRSQ